MKTNDTERNKINKVMQKLNIRLAGFKQRRQNGQNMTWADEMIEDNVKAQIRILNEYKMVNNF